MQQSFVLKIEFLETFLVIFLQFLSDQKYFADLAA